MFLVINTHTHIHTHLPSTAKN